MYIIYGQKGKDDQSGSFPLNSQIRFLADLFHNKCRIFSMPGHLSTGENVKRYIEGFNRLISKSSATQYIGFGNGYNAKNNRNAYINEINNQAANNPNNFYLENYLVTVPQKSRNNHSKALIYFTWKDTSWELKKKYEKREIALSPESIGDFLAAVDVKAVIVGSSNQSYKTYFSPTTDKGEADVLLIGSDNGLRECIDSKEKMLEDIAVSNGLRIKEEFFNDHRDFLENNLIAKTILPPEKYNSDQEFLNAVFKKCLEEELL